MKKLIAEIKNDNATLIEINDVLSVNFGALDRGNITDTTNWGLYSNKGEIVFIDKTKTFKSIISNYEDLSVNIYYSNSQKKQLATFLIDDYEYNDESKQVTLTLKDNLIGWQSQTLDEYYEFFEKEISSIWSYIHGEQSRLTNAVRIKMGLSIVNTSYMQKSSKWSNADKICQATMTRCFCDTDGTPLFADETPKQSNNIIIRPRNILSINNVARNAKTKIKDVSISAKNITKYENEPISDEFPFTLYNIRGVYEKHFGVGEPTQYGIFADWVGYNSSNVTINNYIDWDVPSVGGFVSAKIQKPENLFSYSGADITVNIATIPDSSYETETIQKTTKTTNEKKAQENGYEIYSPDDIIIYNLSTSPRGRSDALLVKFQENEISYPYSDLPELNGVVGNYCITDGTITVIGNFYTEDGEKSYGSTSDKSTTLKSNELIQTKSTYGGKALAQHIIDTVKAKYGNGIECVELEVTPSEYYDDDGINIINSQGNKPLFEKYDIVTPYVIRNGIEQPYSIKEDGSPKSFKIIGIEYSYQGLLRQKLYLQENTNND